MVVSDPRGQDFVTWASTLVLDNGLDVPYPSSEKEWSFWAAWVFDISELNTNPLSFVDWRLWAERVYEEAA